jgi:hypothetical protein
LTEDKLIAAKSGYLNFPFWIARAAIFFGWVGTTTVLKSVQNDLAQ